MTFYAVWNPAYVLLLMASVGLNYLVGLWIERLRSADKTVWPVLALGIAGNLAVLGWYKYANFFVDNYNTLTGSDFTLQKILLPLAISFYTFQQLAYLIDVSRGEVKSGGLSRYATFVIFFPQLIAGPIVHYKEMMPQFFGRNAGRFVGSNFTIGLAIFAIGLFKKTVIADSAAMYSTPVFNAAASGEIIPFFAAWKAALCYTVQLYFDFSGYSDMAVGLARLFGIRLPVNFHSPLRAASIIDYWRRWHITLQRFIVSYMHQPLAVPLTRWAAGKRLGKWSMYYVTIALPTISVFIFIGLWHGAAWTFVTFGLLHGLYLSVNEAWRLYRRKARKKNPPQLLDMIGYHLLTLFCVIMANVVFRAEQVGDAVKIWTGMFRISNVAQLSEIFPASWAEVITEPLCFLLFAGALIALFPNTQQIMGRYHPVLDWKKWKDVAHPIIRLQWRLTWVWALCTGFVLFLAVAFISRGQTEFIYFNF
ncbi:MBOAT family O-acyltransferase [Roseibium album]|uniref:MBOAT family O-acyltransferase n=1 Tax=Roseibium album TaxID=311410 RepID=UPI00248FEFF8|nr:MBOAT family O-acyltransferase [Roseibium album]